MNLARLHHPAAVWAILVLATGATVALAEFAPPGRALVAAALAIAVGKGALVILDFMELRHAPPLWRRLVLGWLAVVAGGVLLTFL